MFKIRDTVKIWKNYITQLYNRASRTENLKVKAKEELDANKKGPYILHTNWKKQQNAVANAHVHTRTHTEQRY
jgi:hypothetical protein